MKRMVLAVALIGGLGGCTGEVTPERIKTAGANAAAAVGAAREIGEQIRLTRCSLIPNADIEELTDCRLLLEDGS